MAGVRVGYVRISTGDQHLENQKSLIQADKFFEDTFTGTTLDRPGFKSMMEYIREGDVLICYSTDRLSRTFSDLIKVVQDLLDKGVKIEFVKEGWKFQNKLASHELLLLSILGICAQFEITQLAERRAIGIKKAREQKGKYTGRKPKFTPDIYKEIVRMHNMKIKKKYIAKSLGVSVATVYNYIGMGGEYKKYKQPIPI